jgi:hypothetical protein
MKKFMISICLLFAISNICYSSQVVDGISYAQLTKKYDHEPVKFYAEQRSFAEEYRLTHNDNLPDTLFWNYLEARRRIDPERFDRNHHLIGLWISEIPVPVEIIPVLPLPPMATCTIQPCKPENNINVIGEPSSGVLLVLAIVVGSMFFSNYRRIFK